ncbi:MAG TPA: helix-turn-helix transcriptional regulator [Anaerolineae bacterium]|nr:helix-turn-helix transcriptional regulator [Anaerolineae bacterium]
MQINEHAAAMGRRIRERRKQLGFSTLDFAKETGISRQHISRIELGETEVTTRMLVAIARALGFSLEGLVWGGPMVVADENKLTKLEREFISRMRGLDPSGNLLKRLDVVAGVMRPRQAA